MVHTWDWASNTPFVAEIAESSDSMETAFTIELLLLGPVFPFIINEPPVVPFSIFIRQYCGCGGFVGDDCNANAKWEYEESAKFEGFGAKKHGDGWASNYGSAKLVSALKTVL